MFVTEPPKILDGPDGAVYQVAQNVRFNCEADGIPKPKVVWYKDGRKIKYNSHIKIGVSKYLHIHMDLP